MQVNKKQKTIFSKLVFSGAPFRKSSIAEVNNNKYGYRAKKANRLKPIPSVIGLLVLLSAVSILINAKTSADTIFNSINQSSWAEGISAPEDPPYDRNSTTITKYSSATDKISASGTIKLNGAAANEQGSLVSSTFKFYEKEFFGAASYEFTGEGKVEIRVRSTPTPAKMNESFDDWSKCKVLDSLNEDEPETIYGYADSPNKCVKRNEQYLQYKITLINDTIPDSEFSVSKVTLRWKKDEQGPRTELPLLLQLSSKVKNTMVDTFTWNQNDTIGWGWNDKDDNHEDGSGIAGMKYCVSDGFQHDGDPFKICSPSDYPQNYVGPSGRFFTEAEARAATPEFIADVFPIENNRLSTNENDPRYGTYTKNGPDFALFIEFVLAIDNVGNFEEPRSFFINKTSTIPSGAPQNITPNNTEPGTNMFSFNWEAPEAKDNPIIQHEIEKRVKDIQEEFEEMTPEEVLEALKDITGMDEIAPEAVDGLIEAVLEAVKQDTTDGALGMYGLFEGSQDEMSYCYMINKSPNPEDEDYYPKWSDDCILVPAGEKELPAYSYGTRQGENYLYMATINEAGNKDPMIKYPLTKTVARRGADGEKLKDNDGDDIEDDFPVFGFDDNGKAIIVGPGDQIILDFINYSKTEFIVETFAPDLPQKAEMTDISNRTDEIWRVVLSWMQPKKDIPPVEKYQITRSTDNIRWDSIGFTDSLSYVDTDPGLNNETKYYYKVKSCDKAGSCSAEIDAINTASKDKSPGITPNGHYTEAASLTANPKVTSISTKKAIIEWQTSRESDSAMFISTSSNVSIKGDYSAGNSNQISSHSLSLSNLQPDTKYYYKTTWTDIDNNTGVSPEMSFTTVAAPQFSEVDFSSISVSGSTVNFTVKDASKVNMYYGKTESFGGISVINTSTKKSAYSVNLSNLDDNTKYYIRLNGFDADGNEYSGNVNSFTTLTRPKISNLKFQPVEDAASNTTKVSWNTNVPATSILNYGIAGGKQLETISSKLTTEHEITIAGLDDNSTYSLVARSRDAFDNLAISDTQTFKTALDTRPPKISKITVDTTIRGTGAEAKGQVIVSWTTDELATSQVAFGQGAPGSYNNKTAEDSTLSYEHTVVISDLSTSSIYQVQPVSRDGANNLSKGSNQSAIIGRGTEDVFMIIFSALRNIFGIKGKL